MTSRCNLACQYCDSQIGIEPRDMPIEIAAAALELAAHFKPAGQPLRIAFYGGEPTLLSGYIAEILDRLQASGLPYQATLITNGTLIENIRPLLEYPIDLRVSLDPPVNGNRECSRGWMSHRTVCDVIRLAQITGHQVAVRATITRQNQAGLVALVQACEKMGVQKLYLAPMRALHNRSKTVSDDVPDPEEYARSFVEAARAIQGNLKIVEPLLSLATGRKISPCASTFIMPDGSVLVTRAEAIFVPRLRLGNVLDRDWIGIQEKSMLLYNEFREQVHNGCQSCWLFHTCSGNLLSSEYKLGTDPNGQLDNTCRTMRALHRHFLPLLQQRADPVVAPGSFPRTYQFYRIRPLSGIGREFFDNV